MAAPPLLSVSLALPSKVLLFPHIIRLVSEFLMPTTLDAAVVYNLPVVTKICGDSRRWTVNLSQRNSIVDQAASGGHLNLVEHFEENPKGNFIRLIKAFETAAENGHVEVVKYLMPPAEHWPLVVKVLNSAVLNGNVEVPKLLLQEKATIRDLTRLTQNVVGRGHLDVANLLVCTGRTKVDVILRAAAKTGYIKFVKSLLPVCDLNAVARAIGAAAGYSHVNLLKSPLKRGDLNNIGSAFVAAASGNNVEAMGLLLDAWETRPAKEPVKRKAISSAVKDAVLLGRLKVVKLLADRCGSMLVGPGLRLSVVNNKVDIVKVLAKVSTQPAFAHQAATAAAHRLSRMTRVLLKCCVPAVLETVLEDMVVFDNIDTAKFMVEKCSDHVTYAVLEIAVKRGCAGLVAFLRGLRGSSISKL